MICIAALIVFGILGIFSVQYRSLAREAFDCVLRRVTFRPCERGFDRKMKMKVFLKIQRFPIIARTWYKHFELISWIFVIAFVVSLFFTGRGLYNLARFGTCDPHSGFCIFNQGNISCGSEQCITEGCDCEVIGCEYPRYEACKGNCTCEETTCG